MGRRLGMGIVWGVLGYLVGAFGGGYLTAVISGNSHDGSVESAMTGAFVTGPIAGLIAAAIGIARSGPRPSR